MSGSDYRPRLSVDITEEQYFKLQKMLPHGTRKEVFGKLADFLINGIESHGERFLGALLTDSLKITITKE